MSPQGWRWLMDSLEVASLSVSRVSTTAGWAHGGTVAHNDPFTRIYLVSSGAGRVWNETEEIVLKPQRLFCIPTHRSFHYQCHKPMELICIHFTCSLLAGLDPFRFLAWQRELPLEPASRQLAESLLPGLEPSLPAVELARRGRLLSLLALFLQPQDEAPYPAALTLLPRFLPAFQYMHNHLAERVSLARLASVCNLDATYFSNLFSRTFGLPPLRYLQRYRLNRACLLLSRRDTTIREIADTLGFTDQFHFSRLFRREYGASPRQWRDQGVL